MIKKGPCNRAGLSGLGVPRVGGEALRQNRSWAFARRRHQL